MTNPHQFLKDQISDLDRVLPIQAPLNDFVHFNPLMNYDCSGQVFPYTLIDFFSLYFVQQG